MYPGMKCNIHSLKNQNIHCSCIFFYKKKRLVKSQFIVNLQRSHCKSNKILSTLPTWHSYIPSASLWA